MAEHYTTELQSVDPVCDTHEPETTISGLGEIVEVPICMPRYDRCHTSIVATGKQGSVPGELNAPSGVAIQENTNQIFIANQYNHRVEVFTETGEFLYQLGVGQLSLPYGIAIHGDSVYVSCRDDTVSKLSMNKTCHVRRIGGRGSNNGQFNNPRQLTTDPNGRVLIADYCNHRICIYNPDLNHLRNISLDSMSLPFDVKVLRDCMYVLCPDDNPCMHVLTLEGDMLHSFITCGEEIDVIAPFFFCLDPLNNFVTSNFKSHSIHVFSPEGNLLHMIGREGHQQGMLYLPTGVAITPNERIVCVSLNENYGLQIFY